MLFLLCETNNCKTDIDKVKWVAEKYPFQFAYIYAFEDKLDEGETLVKKLSKEKKPAVFIFEIKNRAYNIFLMKDNVKEKTLSVYSEHHIEEFLRNYLLNYENLLHLQLSEAASNSGETFAGNFKHLEKVTGSNYESKIGNSKDHWLLMIHEGRKEDE